HAGLNGEMQMDGSDVFDFVTTKVPELIEKFVGAYDHIGYFCPHQANMAMNRILAKRAGYTERTLYSIGEYGNQSMCSIPTALAMHEEKILGKHVLLAGFGAGYTATVGSVKWPQQKVAKIVEVT